MESQCNATPCNARDTCICRIACIIIRLCAAGIASRARLNDLRIHGHEKIQVVCMWYSVQYILCPHEEQSRRQLSTESQTDSVCQPSIKLVSFSLPCLPMMLKIPVPNSALYAEGLKMLAFPPFYSNHKHVGREQAAGSPSTSALPTYASFLNARRHQSFPCRLVLF